MGHFPRFAWIRVRNLVAGHCANSPGNAQDAVVLSGFRYIPFRVCVSHLSP